MKVSVLASGSSGNCTLIKSDKNILIDAGISFRRICQSLQRLDTHISDIDAIFITHEHSDHVKGLSTIKKMTKIPIFIHEKAFERLGMERTSEVFFNSTIKLGQLKIEPFLVDHDAVNPFSFIVDDGKKKIGTITDLGRVNNAVKYWISCLDCCVLESNHDTDMLLRGRYPYHLKQRILGPLGHLSNADASLLIREYSSENLRTVFLAHLSHNNNTIEIAQDTFLKINEILKLNTIMTSQEKETKLIEI